MDSREALLATLRDPHPPSVGWWPLAPGWWLVVVTVLLLLLALGLLGARLIRRRRRRHRANAWRRAARAELGALHARLGAGEAPDVLLREASVLARRAVLARGTRSDVAPLHGERWLHALDAASDGTRFTQGPARLLASAPFERAPRVTPEDLTEVLDALDGLCDERDAA